ncbi:MAG: Rrf2 family transcriptional regulator [Flavobacteriales bacterium]|nr:Rrf2 family transcriptional regulator [Flavobacteriales bacterium]
MLSKKAQYAFRALVVLSSEHSKATADGRKMRPLSIPKIVERAPMSTKFLEQILSELRRSEILQARRGPTGGYLMAKEPSDVSLAEVLRLIDGPIAPLKCVSLNYYEKCDDCTEATCGLRRSMAEVRDAKLEVLNRLSVSDLV